MLVKDFFWWLLKENVVINACYRHLVPRFLNASQRTDKTTPVMTKSDIQDYQPKGWFYLKGYSSGTTNTPLTVYRSIKSIVAEEYFFKRYLWSFGVGLRPKIAILRGEHIAHADNTSRAPFKYLPFTSRLLLSSFHINAKTAPGYLAKLEQYQPDVIHAYPSSIALLARFALQLNWRPSWPLKCVVTSSESFSPDDMSIVRQVFKNVGDYYGQAERVAALELCSQGKYHPVAGYSKIEFVQEGEFYKIIGSSLHNKTMPLMRYDTGDYAEIAPEQTCACDKPLPVIERVLGREDDYVVLPNGTKVGRLDVAFKGISGLAQAQIIQDAKGRMLVVMSLTEQSESQAVLDSVSESLRERLGSEIAIAFSFDSGKFKYGKTGKFKSVISEVKQ